MYRAQQELDALDAEAVAVYQRYITEFVRVTMAGGSQSLTPELEATLAEPFRSEVANGLAKQKRDGRVFRGPAPRTLAVADRHHNGLNGALIAVRTCEDLRGVTIHDSNGVQEAQILSGWSYLKRVDGALKVFDSQSEEAETCPLSEP